MTLCFIKQLHSSLIILLTESDEDEGEYIAKDQETEARRNRKTAQSTNSNTSELKTKSWSGSNPPRRGC